MSVMGAVLGLYLGGTAISLFVLTAATRGHAENRVLIPVAMSWPIVIVTSIVVTIIHRLQSLKK